jgi:hypothetical protein
LWSIIMHVRELRIRPTPALTNLRARLHDDIMAIEIIMPALYWQAMNQLSKYDQLNIDADFALHRHKARVKRRLNARKHKST